MDLIEYFERQRKRCERELKYAEAAGFRSVSKLRKASRTSPRSTFSNYVKPTKSISG